MSNRSEPTGCRSHRVPVPNATGPSLLGLAALIAVIGCSTGSATPTPSPELTSTPASSSSATAIATPTASTPSGTVLVHTFLTTAPSGIETNVLSVVVGFQNTSLIRAAVFTPQYTVTTSAGAVVYPPSGSIFLFPGEKWYPWFVLRSGTVVASASAVVGAVSWLDPAPGSPPQVGPGVKTGLSALSYQSNADACKNTPSGLFAGCTWVNESPYPIRVQGAVDICGSTNGQWYQIRQFAAAPADAATVIPANGSAFVPIPPDVQNRLMGGDCVLPDLIVTVEQPAFVAPSQPAT